MAVKKSSHSTSQFSFLQQVLSCFGACVECLDQAIGDHCRTSGEHPQVDDLLSGWCKLTKRDCKIWLTRWGATIHKNRYWMQTFRFIF